MATLTLDPPRGGFDAADAARRALLFGVAIQLALLAPSLIALGLDERLINGVSVWSKPVKFQLSLSLMLLTVAWLLPLLPPARRASRWVRWAALATATAATLEIAYITLQAARGRASHYNADTPLETTLYAVMGVGATTIVTGAFVVGVAIWRSPPAPGRAGLRLGAAVGLTLGAVLTLITAGILSGGGEAGHWVGASRTDAGGLPLFGWSRVGGDLRVPHFFATHIMQALPLLGLAADRLAPRRAIPAVWIGAGLGVAIVVATFVQARAGLPFPW